MELLEIRHEILNLKNVSKISYYSIIVKDLCELIDKFLNYSVNEMLSMEQPRDIIMKFDKLRSDYNNKLKSNAQSQTFSKKNIEYLNILFAQIRFILTRFGRVINFIDVLEQPHKRKQISRKMSVKQAPAIQKIQQQECYLYADIEASNNTRSMTG